MKHLRFFLPIVLGLGVFCPHLSSQVIGSPGGARELLDLSVRAYDSTDYKSASLQAMQAFRYFSRKQAPGDHALAAYHAGRAYLKRDSFPLAQFLLETAVHVWDSLSPTGSREASKARCELAEVLLNLKQPREAIAQTEIALQFLKQSPASNLRELALAWSAQGRIYYATGQYMKARPAYEEALKSAESGFGKDSRPYARILNKLGYLYGFQSSDKTMPVLEEAMTIHKKLKPVNQRDVADCYQAMASYHVALKKFDDALSYLRSAEEILIELHDTLSNGASYLYSEMGQAYLGARDFDGAIRSFDKSRSILEKMKAENDPAYGYVSNDLARAYYQAGKFPESILWQKKALELLRGPAKAKSPDVASILLWLGRAQSANGDFADAIASFQEDHDMLLDLYGPECDILYYSESEMGKTYRRWYQAVGVDSLLVLSGHHLNRAEASIHTKLQQKKSARAQRRYLIEANTIAENGLETEACKMTNREALEKAWQLSESRHAYLLNAVTQESNVRRFAGIPESELMRDSLLRTEAVTLENKRYAMLNSGKYSLTDSAVMDMNARIYAKREEIRQMTESFEQRYPAYFQLKYNTRTLDIRQTQQLLGPDQTMLEYFCGDSSIFIFVVKPDTAFFCSMDRDFPLQDWVNKFREGISSFHAGTDRSPQKYERYLRQYATYGYKLYDKLLAPLQRYLTAELIIIPGEDLGNLPFEALLANPPKDVANFKTYSFLIRQHSFQYAYSAVTLQQSIKRDAPASNELFAVAPFFAEDTAYLALRLRQDTSTPGILTPLPYSGEEVLRIKKQFKNRSEVWIGDQGSKSRFMANAGNYRVLHLATHGKANMQEGDFSYLAFAPENGESNSGLLSVGELYNCHFNAELVVLSACETGLGEELLGEGVVSLARAFAYAGANSIVASLWSVNDQSTMQLMDEFYRQLIKGQTKDLALAHAKRQYLDQNPGAFAHPFYWAAFIQIGDRTPLR